MREPKSWTTASAPCLSKPALLLGWADERVVGGLDGDQLAARELLDESHQSHIFPCGDFQVDRAHKVTRVLFELLLEQKGLSQELGNPLTRLQRLLIRRYLHSRGIQQGHLHYCG